MTEETNDPRRTAPWGIVLSVAVSGVAGYALLLALTLAIPSISGVLSAKDASGNPVPTAIAVLQMALGAKFGNAMAALASMAMWFCGLSCVTSASRALYSLARDRGTPWPSLFSRVNRTHGTPGPAIWAIVVASLAVMIWSGAVPIVTSLSTVALYIAYIIPIVFAVKSRLAGSDWPRMSVWSLGRWGLPLNIVAISYTVLISIVLIMPPNALSGKTLAGVVIALALIYLISVRRKFRGPEWTRQNVSISTVDVPR
jgi:amino acid transporter